MKKGLKLRQKDVKIKTSRVKSLININYKRKDAPKKHGEWLADFHLKENISLTELHACGIENFRGKRLLRLIAQNAVFSRKNVTRRKQNFAFRSAKIAQKFCERNP